MMTLSNDEKEELENLKVTPQELNGRDLIRALIIFFLIFCFFIPKIYVSNQIYYLSRDISKMENHLDLLQEENKKLNQEQEKFRFKQLSNIES